MILVACNLVLSLLYNALLFHQIGLLIAHHIHYGIAWLLTVLLAIGVIWWLNRTFFDDWLKPK
jgi:hypothetical protein